MSLSKKCCPAAAFPLTRGSLQQTHTQDFEAPSRGVFNAKVCIDKYMGI